MIQQTQPKDAKPTTRERKVRRGVYWPGEGGLKQKRRKTNGRKASDSGTHFSVSSGDVITAF